jgi:hypothetical protein
MKGEGVNFGGGWCGAGYVEYRLECQSVWDPTPPGSLYGSSSIIVDEVVDEGKNGRKVLSLIAGFT